MVVVVVVVAAAAGDGGGGGGTGGGRGGGGSGGAAFEAILPRGSSVRLVGLQSAAKQRLNGRTGRAGRFRRKDGR